MQDKFLTLEKEQAKKLLKLIKEEHGNLAAICTITGFNPRTVKNLAAGGRAKVETIERIKPILYL